MEDRSPRGKGSISRAAWVACLFLAWAALVCLVVPGFRWGLPSEARNRLRFGPERNNWRAPEMPPEEIEEPWSAYPNVAGARPSAGRHARSALNPIRSYHPDEYAILKSLSGMSPSRLDFDPGFFGWPALQMYLVGAALQVASWTGLARVAPDVNFYFRNPEAMARLYEVGRVVTLLFALGCVAITWRASTRLFGQEGGAAAALLLAVTPLFTINARYLTADIPMLFWISLTLLASTHILKKGAGRRWYVLAGIFLGLAAGTRYQGALAAIVIATAHVMRKLDAEQARTTNRGRWRLVLRSLASRELWLAAGVSAVVFLAVNPYVLLRPAQFCRELAGELRGARNPMSNWKSALLFGDAMLDFLFALTALASLLMALVRKDRKLIFILIGFGLPAFFLWVNRPVMVRYMMPALLLPVLLVAWAFATLHRRGVEIGKRASNIAAPVLLIILLASTSLHSFSYTLLFADPTRDTRTTAGTWIARNIPEGATIGVVSEPWQFELPPINPNRYNIVVVEPSPEALAATTPDYFISSDLQFPPIAVRGPLTPSELILWRAISQGGMGYKVSARFEAWPYGRRSLLRFGPHDMRYPNPAIVVTHKRE